MTDPYYADGRVTLYHGNALDLARELPDRSVGCIVTSPPYFGLRDYGTGHWVGGDPGCSHSRGGRGIDKDYRTGQNRPPSPARGAAPGCVLCGAVIVDDQFGAENTLEQYVSRMVALFAELRRALTDEGTLWLNLGDTYAGRWGSIRPEGRGGMAGPERYRTTTSDQLPEKNLMGVPWRVAFGLQDDGWILRSEIIWAKPNPMPESVTDRPTKSHEQVFLFSKSERYHYAAAAIAEPSTGKPAGNGFDRPQARGPADRGNPEKWVPKSWRDREYDQSMLPASMQQNGKKGRVSGPATGPDIDTRNARDVWTIPTQPYPGAHFAVFPAELPRRCIRAGAAPSTTVLDPFSGSGTTGQVALMEDHPYIGFDLNSDYLDLSIRDRFAQQPLDLGELT